MKLQNYPPHVVLNVPKIKRRPFPKPRSSWIGPFIFYAIKYWRLLCSQGKKTLPSLSNKQVKKKHWKRKKKKNQNTEIVYKFSAIQIRRPNQTLQESSWDKPKNWIKQLTCLQVFSSSDLKNNLGKEAAEIMQKWLSFKTVFLYSRSQATDKKTLKKRSRSKLSFLH